MYKILGKVYYKGNLELVFQFNELFVPPFAHPNIISHFISVQKNEDVLRCTVYYRTQLLIA